MVVALRNNHTEVGVSHCACHWHFRGAPHHRHSGRKDSQRRYGVTIGYAWPRSVAYRMLPWGSAPPSWGKWTPSPLPQGTDARKSEARSRGAHLGHGGGHPERGGRELPGWSKAQSHMVNTRRKSLLRPQFRESSFDTDSQPLTNGRQVIMCILRRHVNVSRTLARSLVGHWPDSDGTDRIQRCCSQDVAILVEHNV